MTTASNGRANPRPLVGTSATPSGSEPRMKWEKPQLRRLAAENANTGILFGPEILILLS